MVSGIETFAGAMLALAVYAVGKTFFWPTMLAVVGDRFPRTGAIAMSIMGGIGMMSAGLLGGPGLGYAKDRFTAEHLQDDVAGDLRGVQGAGAEQVPVPRRSARASTARSCRRRRPPQPRRPSSSIVADASIVGDRETLKADAFIPAAMALIYLLLFLYFKTSAATGRCTSTRRRRRRESTDMTRLQIAHAGCVAALLATMAAAGSTQTQKNILLIADRPSHGPLQHEHNAAVHLFERH